jgi:hypothetical protein
MVTREVSMGQSGGSKQVVRFDIGTLFFSRTRRFLSFSVALADTASQELLRLRRGEQRVQRAVCVAGRAQFTYTWCVHEAK